MQNFDKQRRSAKRFPGDVFKDSGGLHSHGTYATGLVEHQTYAGIMLLMMGVTSRVMVVQLTE